MRPHYFPTTPPQFTQYPYWSVLAGDVPFEQLRDKIVIVGFLDSSLAAPGTVTTPASDASPAVLTAASTVASIVEGKVYSRPTYAIALEWLVAVAVVAFAAFVLKHAWRQRRKMCESGVCSQCEQPVDVAEQLVIELASVRHVVVPTM